MADKSSKASTGGIHTVQLDALVALKIVRHCQSSLPRFVSGQLLGLDVKDTLEVTSCFPVPFNEEDAVNDEGGLEDFSFEMMRCLRTVNADSSSVGWYTTSILGSYLASAIENQFTYQNDVKKAVLIVYDPLRTEQGNLCLRAFRLTEPFMQVYREKGFTLDALVHSNLSFLDIYEELPVTIHASSLAKAFLLEIDTYQDTRVDYDRLDLAAAPHLEKNMEFLLDTMDELVHEQKSYEYFKRSSARQLSNLEEALRRRRDENQRRLANGEQPLLDDDILARFKLPESPSRMESLVLAAHINAHCEQIVEFVGQSYARKFMGRSVQSE